MAIKKVLVTGVAGFIGFHVAMKLLELGIEVVGVDNINKYYSQELKMNRLKQLELYSKTNKEDFLFEKIDITDLYSMNNLFEKNNFNYVINLAGQAGVRYSIEEPREYLKSNVDGFMNILELSTKYKVEQLVYASSSSVYGNSKDIPLNTSQHSSSPESMYAATKKMNELMAYVQTSQFGLKTTGLRFFTVYGPWGRPDMAPFKFAEKIMKGEPIDLYNNGDHLRDFTYIDDVVNGVIACFAPDLDGLRGKEDLYRVYNVGCQNPVKLLDFVDLLEVNLGMKAERVLKPMQPGDVYATYANSNQLTYDKGWMPKVQLPEGIALFSDWFKSYNS